MPHHNQEFCHASEELDLTEHLAILKERLQQMHEATSQDPNLRVLMLVVQQGWPHMSLVLVEAKPYCKCHNELSV